MLTFVPILTLFFYVEVADLRLALQRADQQQAKKEDYLREEISELQQVTRAPYFLLTGIIALSNSISAVV